MAITPLNQLDVYRIVHDFDRDHFNIAKPLRDDQVDRIRVVIQLERLLASFGIPLELIDDIMRRCLKDSPSVGALLMYYKNTPAITLHPLPLSNEAHYINTASKSLLVQLKRTPTDGELASYRKLMTWVFKSHFKKLTLDQKLELIRRSNITPWEQRSTSQKLELLGRIQAPTLWGKAKIRLQLLSWKIQLAAAWALENYVYIWAMVGAMLAFLSASLILWIAEHSSYAGTAFSKTLRNGLTKVFVFHLVSWFILVSASLGASLTAAGLGLALQIPILPKSLQEKGAWIQSISWKGFWTAFYLFFCWPEVPEKLHKLLLQSINNANITIEQNSFVNAHLPDLMNQWMQLTLPNDKDTESLLTLQ